MVGQVKHEEEAHGVPEEGRGQTPEALLTRRVPQLELDALTASLASTNSYLCLRVLD